MPPVSTAMFQVEGGYDLDSLNLGEIQLERQDPSVNELRTRFEAIHDVETGVAATIVFEVVEQRSTWDGTEFYRERKQVRVRFTDAVGDGGVLVVGKSDLHTEIESRLINLFDIQPDEIEKVDITTPNIRAILEEDRALESRATYKSVDENTSSASLAGTLEESDTAERLEEHGNKVWVIYESSSFDRKVGISAKNSAVVFYGDWDDDEMSRYWRRIILPHVTV